MARPVILIVDDEKDARATLINFLEGRCECDFAQANDGDEALEYLKAHHCDIMLLDIKMPKKSGMSVIKEAKALDRSLDIIMISGWVSEEVAEEAVALGATDYAVKPIDLKAIALKIEHMLYKRAQIPAKNSKPC